jgi:transposase InsO family protein
MDLPGLGGEVVRRAPAPIMDDMDDLCARSASPRQELLTDNGSAYIAGHTRAIARPLGLKPVTTPSCSAQSNGMAESFINTFKCDYVSRINLADATTVMAQLHLAFEHFNNVHSPSSLRMRSPREFRQHQQRIAQTGSASASV